MDRVAAGIIFIPRFDFTIELLADRLSAGVPRLITVAVPSADKIPVGIVFVPLLVAVIGLFADKIAFFIIVVPELGAVAVLRVDQPALRVAPLLAAVAAH